MYGMWEFFRKDIVYIQKSLFDRLGGEKALGEIAQEFYSKVLDDEALQEFFVDMNIVKKKKMQMMFLCMTFREKNM